MTDKPDRQDDELREAFQPFADFMARPSFDKLPDNMQITSGSPMAGRQLTVGDLRKLALTIATPPNRDAAEGVDTYRCDKRNCFYPVCDCRKAAPPKPAPDVMREALEPFRNETKQGWNHLFNYLGGASDGFSKKWSERLKALQSTLSTPVPPSVKGDREAFYHILFSHIPSDMIDGIWQELKEAGVADSTLPDLVKQEKLIERCAKIAEPWPGFSLDESSTDIDRAVVAVRTEIAEKIRAVRP